jgi:excisionase family DNA binding protein
MLEPLLLTPRDAAKALSVCERTLYGLTVPRGDIPVIRAGRLVRYSVEDLKTWIKKSSEYA